MPMLTAVLGQLCVRFSKRPFEDLPIQNSEEINMSNSFLNRLPLSLGASHSAIATGLILAATIFATPAYAQNVGAEVTQQQAEVLADQGAGLAEIVVTAH